MNNMNVKEYSVNCKISPEFENLNKYHSIYKWIPNHNQIRPLDDDIHIKVENQAHVEMYDSVIDHVAVNVFNIKSKLNRNSGLICSSENLSSLKINKFVPNQFKYNIDEGYHYVMWYSHNNISEKEISNDIFESIKNITNNEHFHFVWYVNPKMSIPEVFHVQVFWNTF